MLPVNLRGKLVQCTQCYGQMLPVHQRGKLVQCTQCYGQILPVYTYVGNWYSVHTVVVKCCQCTPTWKIGTVYTVLWSNAASTPTWEIDTALIVLWSNVPVHQSGKLVECRQCYGQMCQYTSVGNW